MKKLFISQPMKGKSDEDILAERKKAIKSAEQKIGEPVEVIDSFFQEAPVDAKPLWFLGKSLELLAGADIAYFAKGWQEARGCKIENTCAIEYGILVIEDYTTEQEGGDPTISHPWVKWYLPRIGPQRIDPYNLPLKYLKRVLGTLRSS